MGSLGAGELIVIAIVALIVFGPRRLPELARTAGELLAKARAATKSLTDALDSEYGDAIAPLQQLKSEYDQTIGEVKNAAGAVGTNLTLPPLTGDTDGADTSTEASAEEPEPSPPSESTDAAGVDTPSVDESGPTEEQAS